MNDEYEYRCGYCSHKFRFNQFNYDEGKLRIKCDYCNLYNCFPFSLKQEEDKFKMAKFKIKYESEIKER